jgi:hypothetical protein
MQPKSYVNATVGHCFLVGFLAYIIIRGVFQQRTKGNEKSVSRVDWRERALLCLVFVGCIPQGRPAQTNQGRFVGQLRERSSASER